MLQRTFTRSLRSIATAQPQTLASRTRLALPRTTAISSQVLQGRRWYSEPSAQEAKKAEEGSAAPEEAAKNSAEAAVQKELEAKKREAIDLTDRLKRSVAEYRNLQEQTKREVQAARDFALQRFAKDLIDSVDNLDRALQNVPEEGLKEGANSELLNLYNGLKMTDDILMSTLKKHGLERFDPSLEGDKFDPNRHEATFQTPMPDKQDGTVFFTQQKGFVYNGRTLRAAKVGVVKNS
ncbi:GrpE-domain-containing protein [Polychaeton citri CBS 116435]|uniref:GrpE protein homolog n=1 Tax=Polychaeton citri CBS 116435 TaxID=1314669 RepID=A0A9P4ULY2_9PEZI|nr:GrpE-domain-containing protein [Polychaeton citri CBS 116435]